MAVINDRKTVVAQNNGMATVYDPTFLSAGFYYPFGMEMPGLTYSASDYRYGFNDERSEVLATSIKHVPRPNVRWTLGGVNPPVSRAGH